MIAAEGYPEHPVKGEKIKIIEAERDAGASVRPPRTPTCCTRGPPPTRPATSVSAGGRVLNVVGSGPDLAAARAAAYAAPQ